MVLPDPQPATTSSKTTKDCVTAHKMCLLVLLKEFCVVKRHFLLKRPVQKPDDTIWEHTNQQNRDFASTMLKLIQNPDVDLNCLINIIHPVLHPKTYQIFIDRLKEIRKVGVSVISDFFAKLETWIVEPAPVLPVIQKSSVLGLFIRRMLLALDKGNFTNLTKLYSKFVVYFDAVFKRCLDESTEIGDSPQREEVEKSEESEVVASQKQGEFFIAQQTDLLQINDTAALPPFDLQQKINELMKGNPALYESCFLSYLNSLRVKEYCGARENIHHHFDRNTTVSQECKSSAASEDLNRSSRYAALNLAILQSLFGHKGEALAALNESVMAAQEVNDNVCLQYCLAWFYRLTDADKEMLIERSIAKSTELGLWYLSSLGIQALAKLKSLTTATPSSVFDVLAKSDVQNCQHSMTDILGPAYALRSGLWSYYGHSNMTQLSSQMLLFLNTSDPVRGGIYHIGEGTCIALRNLAVGYASEGLYIQSALVIDLARELFPTHSEHSHIWQLADLLIKFEQALHKRKWSKALEIQAGIAIFDKDEARLRRAELFINQGNLNAADDILKKLLDEKENTQESPHFYVRTQLLRAELLACTPNKTVALPSLMTCLEKCRSHHLLHLESLVTLKVAACQLELKLPIKARLLLDEILVPLLTHGTAFDRGCCLHLYARCLTLQVLLRKEIMVDSARKELFAALAFDNRAFECWKKVKAIGKLKQVLCLQAHIYKYLGMSAEQHDVSYRCNRLEDEFN